MIRSTRRGVRRITQDTQTHAWMAQVALERDVLNRNEGGLPHG